MINTVFLDMDEVITDFNKGVCEAFNMPYQYETFFSEYKWFPKIGRTRKEVNAKCTIDFWRKLEWMFDGREILEIILDKFNIDQVYLITMPMSNPESATGKWLWIKDNLPSFYKRTIITQAPKHLLARPDTLLIDDKNENVDGFREAGGKALLVPRPWNRAHLQADRTVEVVKEFLGRICQES